MYLHAGKWTGIATFLNRRGLWTTVYWLVFTSEKLHLGSASRLEAVPLVLTLLLVIYHLESLWLHHFNMNSYRMDELIFQETETLTMKERLNFLE